MLKKQIVTAKSTSDSHKNDKSTMAENTRNVQVKVAKKVKTCEDAPMKKNTIDIIQTENGMTNFKESPLRDGNRDEITEEQQPQEEMPIAEETPSEVDSQNPLGIPKLTHLSRSKKISWLRKLLIAEISFEDICYYGEISNSVFKNLYFYLTQLDGRFYKVKHKSHILNGKVSEKGFFTSMDKIGALDLEEIFHDGVEIRYSKHDNKIVIEATEAKDSNMFIEDMDDAEMDGEEVEDTGSRDARISFNQAVDGPVEAEGAINQDEMCEVEE